MDQLIRLLEGILALGLFLAFLNVIFNWSAYIARLRGKKVITIRWMDLDEETHQRNMSEEVYNREWKKLYSGLKKKGYPIQKIVRG